MLVCAVLNVYSVDQFCYGEGRQCTTLYIIASFSILYFAKTTLQTLAVHVPTNAVKESTYIGIRHAKIADHFR